MQNILFWFRRDLRLSDNIGLSQAVLAGNVLPIYIHDEINSANDKPGACSNLWLHNSLSNLNDNLNGNLQIYSGDSLSIIPMLVEQYNISAVYMNHYFIPWQTKVDKKLVDILQKQQVTVFSYNSSLFFMPEEIVKPDGSNYKVFTPFYKKAMTMLQVKKPIPKPTNIKYLQPQASLKTSTISDLKLTTGHAWETKVFNYWTCGENSALEKLYSFIENHLVEYKNARDYPSINGTSKLSPHLHFGEISPYQILEAVTNLASPESREFFIRELFWREFSYNLLHYYPKFRTKNFNNKFDKFGWCKSLKNFELWKHGQTGIPLVDAGMRELWQTGYMHNRVRMVVASFLVKNLNIDWRLGEQWFWDCLFDADHANNSASWQWVAGCGVDAAPYFRIFNPVTQGQKFDPAGEYTLQYVPELQGLPPKYLHNPWEAPKDILNRCNLQLGVNYPYPIVDLKTSRSDALLRYDKIK